MENNEGLYHRLDGPAIIYDDGTEHWYEFGKLHRDNDEPAVIEHNGKMWWYQHGLLHRESGPARVYPDGEAWYLNGLKHRDGDEPAIIYNDGTREWYKHGFRHRDDGPALVFGAGGKQWWNNGVTSAPPEGLLELKDGSYKIVYKDFVVYYNKYGLKHREDGPATVFKDGYKAWYKNGKDIDWTAPL